MGAVTIGPLLFASERFAAILGLMAFVLIGFILSRRIGRRLDSWSFYVVAIGVVAARLGHVLENLATFGTAPVRILYFWQGGFSWPWAILPMVLFTLVRLPGRLRYWSLAPAVIGLFVWNVSYQLTNASMGQEAPPLVLDQLNGPPFPFTEATGRPRVINLWATWCPPCRREMPVLAESAKANPDVLFLFVNQAEDAGKVSRYLSGSGLSIANVLLDRHSAIAQYYSLVGLPVTLFTDEKGTLIDMHLGEISTEILQKKVQRLRQRGTT